MKLIRAAEGKGSYMKMYHALKREGGVHLFAGGRRTIVACAALFALVSMTVRAAEAEAPEVTIRESQTTKNSGWLLGKTKFEASLREVHPLKSDAKVSLDDINGRVEIRAWDREEVEVKAVKRAKTQERLDEVKVEIEARPDRLIIHTKYPKEKKRWGGDQASVDYSINVPKSARLEAITTVNGDVVIEGISGSTTASTVNGSVRVKGSEGNLTLSSVNGRVEAEPALVTGNQSLVASTVNGGVTLTLPSQADAEVSATTVNGGVHSEHPQLSVKKSWPVGSSLHGSVGKGSATVKASAVNGGVKIRQAGSTKG